MTSPLGLVTSHTYDNLGRELTSTQTSDTYPAGLTTTYMYDSLDRVVKRDGSAGHRPGDRRGAHRGDHDAPTIPTTTC